MDYSRPLVWTTTISKSSADIKAKKAIRLRVLTEITAENISFCIQLSGLIDELRHLDGIKGSFYINEEEYLAPAIFHEEGKAASQMIYSNVRELVEQQQYVFDTLWNKSIPSQEKIKEIEEGIQPHIIEIIRDTHEFQNLAMKLARSVREEMLVLYSTAKGFYRQSKLGMIAIAKEMAVQHGVKIRTLTPSSDWIEQQAGEFGKYFDIRYIPKDLQSLYSIENRRLLLK